MWPEGGPLPTRDELAHIFGTKELEHAHEVIDGLHDRGILATRPEDGRLVIGAKGGVQKGSPLPATHGLPGPDHERWRIVNETRKALLSQGARMAATRASVESLAKLCSLLPVDISGPAREADDAGGGFEREVVAASGNDLMLRIYDRLVILELTTRVKETPRENGDARLAFARRELLTAITARQPQAAALLADRIP